MQEKNEFFCLSHSKFLLQAHLIFVVKYRKKLLTGEIENFVKNIFNNIAAQSDFKIDVMETDQDHIHMIVNYKPHIAITQIVRRLKSMSTVSIWKIHSSFLKNHFWKEKTFWSDGYFAASIGNASNETVKKYIEEQG
jgi:putative transposase